MGGGDIKLMGMLGAFLGWKAILPVIFLSAVQGSAAGILLLIVRSRRFGEEYRAAHPGDNFAPTRSHIPYGPFISLAAVEYLFFGPVIFDVVSFFQG
jgi:leader peptidase (prepilin peptidase)/N-methyltransferase